MHGEIKMSSVRPSYLVALVLIIVFAIYSKIGNPYREYSTEEFWENATLESVSLIPDEALLPGNKNGPVIMWAAIGTSDIEIIKALVDRDVDINESDMIFKGIPISGAAGYSKNPEIIKQLIELGADVNKKVHNGETALMIAARYNETPGIATMLVQQGARIDDEDNWGNTALDFAKKNNNSIVIEELESLMN